MLDILSLIRVKNCQTPQGRRDAKFFLSLTHSRIVVMFPCGHVTPDRMVE